jgi:sulfoacetaldehyde acetyltransferase
LLLPIGLILLLFGTPLPPFALQHPHSLVSITPECGTNTTGLGGFQETDQLTIFAKMTKYQAHVNNPARIAEYTGRAFDIAMNERGPVQVNIPRDYFYGENDFVIPVPHVVEKSAGGQKSLNEAAHLIAHAKKPVIISGGGVVMGHGLEHVKALAEFLHAPVATTVSPLSSLPTS